MWECRPKISNGSNFFDRNNVETRIESILDTVFKLQDNRACYRGGEASD